MTVLHGSGRLLGARILYGLALAILTPGAARAATTVVANIPNGAPVNGSGVGANPLTNKVYVALPFRGLQVVDGASNTELSVVVPGAIVAGVAVNPNLNRIYAADYGNGTGTQIFVINGANDTLITPVAVGTGPFWIGVNPVTDFKYVGNIGPNLVNLNDGSVSVIDNTNTVIATVTLTGSGDPAGIRVDTVTGRVFVANQGANTIDVINPATNLVVNSIPGMNGPIDVVVDSVNRRAYVANYNNDTLTVIDTMTETVLGSPILVGDGPYGVALNPARNRAYVSSNNNGSRVSVVNTLTRGTEETVTFLIGLGPQDAEYNSANDSIYVSTAGGGVTNVLRDEGEVCSSGAGPWWNTAWRRRRPISINNGNIAETFTGFPLLIKLDTSRIDYTKTKPGGDDLRFVADDDFTVLDYEIEKWTPGGTSYVWVRVPTIFGIAITTISMYFDNPGAPLGQNPAAVWDSDFKLVHHLAETAGAHLDSTSNPNDSIVVDVATQGSAAGQINGADSFSTAGCLPSAATCDNIDIADHPTLDVGAAESLTVEAWIRTPTAGAFQHIAVKEAPGAGTGFDFLVWNSNQARFAVTNSALIPTFVVAMGGMVADNAWHYVVGRWTRSTSTADVFVDGVVVGTASNGVYAASPMSNTQPFRIGERGDIDTGGFNFNGTIDEVRFSKGATPRSNDWIQAQWRSMRDQYVSFGAEAGLCNFRSIGNRVYGTGQILPADGAGTMVNPTVGSRTVNGVGTAWITANRGRGDSITFGAFIGTILSVDSNTQLTLTSPSTVGGSLAYTISRKFATLTAWEDCIDGGSSCGPDPVVTNSLVSDNRGEIGIAYKDVTQAAGLVIDGTVANNTDAAHTITLTADLGNRHYGLAGQGVLVDLATGNVPGIEIRDDFVTVEWLELRAAVGSGTSAHGIEIGGPLAAGNQIVLRNLLIHGVGGGMGGSGINVVDRNTIADVQNSFIYEARRGIAVNPPLALAASSRIRIFSNTVYGCNGPSAQPTGIAADSAFGPFPTITLRDNIAHGNVNNDFGVPGLSAVSSHNLASDTTGTTHSFPPATGFNSVPLGPGPLTINFVSTTANFENLHIQGGSRAENVGANLGGFFGRDIDNVVRLAPWEIGADDTSQTTAVTLQSFTAAGRNGAADLSWTTASELQNLGFHLYRGDSANGPYTRITSSLIPGLGSSPTGQSYSYRDDGLVNGRTYYYELEDVETTGRTERHGPVSATPAAGGPPTPPPPPGPSGTSYGDPSSVVLREVERSPNHVVLELLTGGFVASPAEGGRVRLRIPGFESASRPGEPELPMRRALVEAAAGKKVRLSSVVASDILRFPGLRPASQGVREIEVSDEGMVSPSEKASREGPAFSRVFPSESARLKATSFQRETKRAEVLLFPLRWDGSGLVLSRRLLVRLQFSGTERGETTRGGSRGRRRVERAGPRGGVVAQLVAKGKGLYRVDYEELFGTGAGSQRRGISASNLRLSRQGESVAFHVGPQGAVFGPGSSLYFLSEGSDLNPYGNAVYELETNTPGLLMEVEGVTSGSGVVLEHIQDVRLEENHFYQAGLLEAPDLWLWDLVVSPGSKSFGFTVDALSASSSTGRLTVVMQGASDFPGVKDHHVRVRVNGTFVGETTWDGKLPKTLEADVAPQVLREGANTVELEDVGDAGAAYSLVFLNRFKVSYPRRLVASQGKLEGRFEASGLADIEGSSGSSFVLDTTDVPRWLTGASPTRSGLSLPVQAGRSYLVTSTVLRPEVKRIGPSGLRNTTNRADYLLLAPRVFLQAAQPLLDLREGQGLVTKAVSLEEVYEQFGHGEEGPQGIKEFLEYAYHSWTSPSPRYVVLLGDASYDPKDYLKTGVKDWIPGFPVRTSYLWTVSDPGYASVNGADLLPDLAIGRLPAASVDEAQRLVQKVLAFENGGGNFGGPAVLVADNPDLAGNFEQNADEIASGVLASRNPKKIYYSREGANTRTKIEEAFDEGASLMSYVGHGGTVVWASENIFNYQDVQALHAQSQQPLLLTMNCLNGFFHFPPLNSLSEELLKAEGKGVIAAFSPSGLSLNDAAHLLHKALLEEIVSGRHERLGDAILAAQERYSASGAFPELLSIYHLFGDPAIVIR